MKHQIKHRYTDDVIFECEVPAQSSGVATRYAIDQAVKARADLSGAKLLGANLYGANLSDAYLSDANLSGANLSDADLSGAKVADKTLIGERPIFQIGPIGSRCAYFVSFITDGGVMLRAGCFFGSVFEFREKLSREHGNNNHATEYTAALALIECHAKIWTPEPSQEQA